jgi:NAD-dependent deacetylase
VAVERCTHFLAVGTSGLVWPAAGLLHAARGLGAATWVQSLDPPENLHPADRFRPGRAAEVVPDLVEELCAALGLDPAPEESPA